MVQHSSAAGYQHFEEPAASFIKVEVSSLPPRNGGRRFAQLAATKCYNGNDHNLIHRPRKNFRSPVLHYELRLFQFFTFLAFLITSQFSMYSSSSPLSSPFSCASSSRNFTPKLTMLVWCCIRLSQDLQRQNEIRETQTLSCSLGGIRVSDSSVETLEDHMELALV